MRRGCGQPRLEVASTADNALRARKAFGITPSFWTSLQLRRLREDEIGTGLEKITPIARARRIGKGCRVMNHQQSDLVGTFLVLDSADHEHYRTGHIAAAVGDSYLIQFDKSEEEHPLPPMELFTLGELSGTCQNCGQKLANLFKTREEMMRWIAWLNEPEKPAGDSSKVVHLKKRR